MVYLRNWSQGLITINVVIDTQDYLTFIVFTLDMP